MTAIETSREITLDRLLVALSVANLGKTYAKELAEHFDYDIDALLKAVAEDYDFSKISGFGDVISNSIKTYFKTYDISSILSEIRLIKPKKATYQDTPLSGKTFCITGTFPIPRSRLEAILISLGGVSMSGVSSKTHMLFVGEDAGSKVSLL
jgi:DNA ligase (NAD+)